MIKFSFRLIFGIAQPHHFHTKWLVFRMLYSICDDWSFVVCVCIPLSYIHVQNWVNDRRNPLTHKYTHETLLSISSCRGTQLSLKFVSCRLTASFQYRLFSESILNRFAVSLVCAVVGGSLGVDWSTSVDFDHSIDYHFVLCLLMKESFSRLVYHFTNGCW